MLRRLTAWCQLGIPHFLHLTSCVTPRLAPSSLEMREESEKKYGGSELFVPTDTSPLWRIMREIKLKNKP